MMCDRSIGFPKVCPATTASWILTVPHNLSGIGIDSSAQLSRPDMPDNTSDALPDEITGITGNTTASRQTLPF